MDEKTTNHSHREGERPVQHHPRRRKKKRMTVLGVLLYLVFVIGVSALLAGVGWVCANDVLALNKASHTTVITLNDSIFTEKEVEREDGTVATVNAADIGYVADLLKEEGLIEYVPNKGCFAKGFTKRDIEDVYAVRKVLEELTVEWAVKRITDEEVAKMAEKCEEMQGYVDQADSARVLASNKEFHEIIYHATGSRFMSQVLRSYKEYIEQTTRPIFYEPKFLQQIVDEHRAIVDAFEKRDTEEAVAAMSQHMTNSMGRAEYVYKV